MLAALDDRDTTLPHLHHFLYLSIILGGWLNFNWTLKLMHPTLLSFFVCVCVCVKVLYDGLHLLALSFRSGFRLESLLL